MSASKVAKGMIMLITALTGWSVGRAFNSTLLVSGNSMEPTLHAGQVLDYKRTLPDRIPRGTIVVVRRFPGTPCVKRVIGLPRESVSFHRGEVFINGSMLREPYLPEEVTTYSWGRECLVTQEDEYVLLGDNRLVSTDSRDYGVISRKDIVAVLDIPCGPPRLLQEPEFRIKVHRNRGAFGAQRHSVATPSLLKRPERMDHS
jgi:signal peptidase I